MAMGGDIDMIDCNSGSYKISNADVKFDSDRMVVLSSVIWAVVIR